jgi:hypothetical protein
MEFRGQAWWHILVTLAAWEAEIRNIKNQGLPREKLSRAHLNK